MKLVCVCVSCYYDSDIASSCSRSCRYSLSFSCCSNWILITTEFTFRPLASGDNKKKTTTVKANNIQLTTAKYAKSAKVAHTPRCLELLATARVWTCITASKFTTAPGQATRPNFSRTLHADFRWQEVGGGERCGTRSDPCCCFGCYK